MIVSRRYFFVKMNSVGRMQGKALFQELVQIVNECQQQFEGKKEIATESNPTVKKLCSTWENVLCFGIKSTKNKILETIDIIGKLTDFPLWDFCQSHMTKDERERFENLKNVSTKRGKLNALIRSSLNERSLERYLSMWLGDIGLQEFYEPWSVMLNMESGRCLPSLAQKLSNILFAIQVDTTEIDYEKPRKKEPLIFAPLPVGPKKRTNAIKRRILTSPDDTSLNAVQTHSDKEINTPNVQPSIVEACTEELAEICIDTSTVNLPNPEDEAVTNEEPKTTLKQVNVVTSCKVEEQNNLPLKQDVVMTTSLDVNLNLQEVNHNSCDVDDSSNYFSVSIPRVVLKNSNRKKFYVYEIKIDFMYSDSLVIERRYSEFLQMHDSIKKKYDVVKVLDFPPKKFGNMSKTFIEERRQRLQIYLNHLLRLLPETMYCRTKKDMQAALEFFKL